MILVMILLRYILKNQESDVEPHMAEEIESHSHNTPKKESQASQQNLKAQTMTKRRRKRK